MNTVVWEPFRKEIGIIIENMIGVKIYMNTICEMNITQLASISNSISTYSRKIDDAITSLSKLSEEFMAHKHHQDKENDRNGENGVERWNCSLVSQETTSVGVRKEEMAQLKLVKMLIKKVEELEGRNKKYKQALESKDVGISSRHEAVLMNKNLQYFTMEKRIELLERENELLKKQKVKEVKLVAIPFNPKKYDKSHCDHTRKEGCETKNRSGSEKKVGFQKMRASSERISEKRQRNIQTTDKKTKFTENEIDLTLLLEDAEETGALINQNKIQTSIQRTERDSISNSKEPVNQVKDEAENCQDFMMLTKKEKINNPHFDLIKHDKCTSPRRQPIKSFSSQTPVQKSTSLQLTALIEILEQSYKGNNYSAEDITLLTNYDSNAIKFNDTLTKISKLAQKYSTSIDLIKKYECQFKELISSKKITKSKLQKITQSKDQSTQIDDTIQIKKNQHQSTQTSHLITGPETSNVREQFEEQLLFPADIKENSMELELSKIEAEVFHHNTRCSNRNVSYRSHHTLNQSEFMTHTENTDIEPRHSKVLSNNRSGQRETEADMISMLMIQSLTIESMIGNSGKQKSNPVVSHSSVSSVNNSNSGQVVKKRHKIESMEKKEENIFYL